MGRAPGAGPDEVPEGAARRGPLVDSGLTVGFVLGFAPAFAPGCVPGLAGAAGRRGSASAGGTSRGACHSESRRSERMSVEGLLRSVRR